MFSVKKIALSGHEELWTSRQVNYEPSQSQGCNDYGTVWIDMPDGSRFPLTGGTIFVMNESGKTVARYDLGASRVPIVGDGLSDPRPRGLAEHAYAAANTFMAGLAGSRANTIY